VPADTREPQLCAGAPLFLEGGIAQGNNGPLFAARRASDGRLLSLEHTKEALAVTYQVWAQQVTTVALCGMPVSIYIRGEGDDGPFDI